MAIPLPMGHWAAVGNIYAHVWAQCSCHWSQVCFNLKLFSDDHHDDSSYPFCHCGCHMHTFRPFKFGSQSELAMKTYVHVQLAMDWFNISLDQAERLITDACDKSIKL